MMLRNRLPTTAVRMTHPIASQLLHTVPHLFRRLLWWVVPLSVLALAFQTSPPSLADTPASQPVAVCPPVPAYRVRCYALRLQPPPSSAAGTIGASGPFGYTPADLQSAYDLPSATRGFGQTVAIVDANDDPAAESDLAVYRSTFGLPPCTTTNGCFRKVDQTGGTQYPKNDQLWSEEIALDTDMVSASCPNCHILLVEAKSDSIQDLGAAINEAAALHANVISLSWGNDELPDEGTFDRAYLYHPGIPIVVASGDWQISTGGLLGLPAGHTSWPAVSPFVTSVGGTSLSRSSNSRGWTEVAWAEGTLFGGSTSGCSIWEPQPIWQLLNPNIASVCLGRRAAVDVSAVADPFTGVASYNSNFLCSPVLCLDGWQLGDGGTSAAAPLIAAMYALAGNEGAVSFGSSPFLHPQAFNDVTGSELVQSCGTLLCNGAPGWDGPTGLGTPHGVAGFTGGGLQPTPRVAPVPSHSPIPTTLLFGGHRTSNGAFVCINGAWNDSGGKCDWTFGISSSSTNLTASALIPGGGINCLVMKDPNGKVIAKGCGVLSVSVSVPSAASGIYNVEIDQLAQSPFALTVRYQT